MNLIKVFVGVALLSTIALPASAAVGDGTFDAFKQACGDTNGDYAAASTAVNAQAWRPSQVNAPTMGGVTITDQFSRTRTTEDGEVTLIATQGKTANGIHVSTCTVYGPTAGVGELQSRTRSWLGFAPHDSTAQVTTFHFASEGGQVKDVADADSDAAAAGSGLNVLTVKVDSGKAILDLIKIKK